MIQEGYEGSSGADREFEDSHQREDPNERTLRTEHSSGHQLGVFIAAFCER